MKIAIRSKYSLYEFYMDTLLVIILFSGYLEHLRLWRLLSVALFALSLVTNSRQYKKLINRNFLFVLSALFLIFILLISSFVSDSTEYVVTNLKGLFYPICLILTYAGVAGYDIEKLYLYFKKMIKGLLGKLIY